MSVKAGGKPFRCVSLSFEGKNKEGVGRKPWKIEAKKDKGLAQMAIEIAVYPVYPYGKYTKSR